jgi:hypothetical protein
MPGTPKNVGNAGDIVCVRSITERVGQPWACAIVGATAVAANPAAAPCLKNERRDRAALTTS